MKKILILTLSAVLFCVILIFSGCGRNKPSNSTASSSSSSQTTSSQSTSASETTETFQTTNTSDFFESSNGTLESTTDPETMIPSPMKN